MPPALKSALYHWGVRNGWSGIQPRAQMTPNEPSKKRILIADDDAELCALVAQYLSPEGFLVDVVHNGTQVAERAGSGDYALVVLDVMLPGIDGFEVLRQVRMRSRTPVLMLTARGDEQDRIRGLEMGADDYLPKPFNPRELLARIEAVLRRSKHDPAETDVAASERLVAGDIELDKGARVVRRAGKEVELTTVEFDLLEKFLTSAGSVMSREDMVRAVLGREFSPFDRSLDTHVSNLRRKLGPGPDGAERIKGVRGIGYQYALPRNLR